MTRSLVAGFATAVQQDESVIVHLMEIAFDTCTGADILYWTTGSMPLSWNSKTWSAIGGVMSWDSIPEGGDDRAAGVPVTLSGVDLSIIALVLLHDFRGRPVIIRRAHLNKNTGAVVSDPYIVFKGLMNDKWEMEEKVSESGSTVEVRTRLVSRLALFRATKGVRTNLVSHRRYYTGDTFFQNVAGLAGQKIYWGVS